MNYVEFVAPLKLDEQTKKTVREAARRADLEHKEKQRAGILRAKENGVLFGRPRAKVQELDHLHQKYLRRELSLTDAAKLSGVSRSTIYRRFREQTQRLAK